MRKERKPRRSRKQPDIWSWFLFFYFMFSAFDWLFSLSPSTTPSSLSLSPVLSYQSIESSTEARSDSFVSIACAAVERRHCVRHNQTPSNATTKWFERHFVRQVKSKYWHLLHFYRFRSRHVHFVDADASDESHIDRYWERKGSRMSDGTGVYIVHDFRWFLFSFLFLFFLFYFLILRLIIKAQVTLNLNSICMQKPFCVRDPPTWACKCVCELCVCVCRNWKWDKKTRTWRKISYNKCVEIRSTAEASACRRVISVWSDVSRAHSHAGTQCEVIEK